MNTISKHEETVPVNVLRDRSTANTYEAISQTQIKCKHSSLMFLNMLPTQRGSQVSSMPSIIIRFKQQSAFMNSWTTPYKTDIHQLKNWKISTNNTNNTKTVYEQCDSILRKNLCCFGRKNDMYGFLLFCHVFTVFCLFYYFLSQSVIYHKCMIMCTYISIYTLMYVWVNPIYCTANNDIFASGNTNKPNTRLFDIFLDIFC